MRSISQLVAWSATLLVLAVVAYTAFNAALTHEPTTSENGYQHVPPKNFPDKFSSQRACRDAGVEKAIVSPEGDVADGYYRRCLQDGTYKIVDGAYEDLQADKAWEEYQRSNE